MKKVILLLCTLVISLPLFAQPDAPPNRINELFRFIAHNEGLRNIALHSLISNRCNRYLSYHEARECRKAVKKMIMILDHDVIITDKKKLHALSNKEWNPRSFVFIAFKKELIHMLSSYRTTAYLKKLNEKLTHFLTGQEPDLNVWEFTLGYFRSPVGAARVMATLFQDTSMMRLHLAYLERTQTRGCMNFTENKELLSRVISTINMVLDYSEDNYRKLFYPRGLKKYLNKNIYHFYVPLYLSMALKTFETEKKMAHIAPLMLTLTYEFITAAPDHQYLLRDPDYIDPRTNLHKLKDIYGAHTGAWFGIGKKPSASFFPLMQDQFARSTRDGIEFLLGR